jgi:glycosyltransferase involved in cell wall biosynthesis
MQPPYTLARARELTRFDKSVSLLCWAYNEEESIARFLMRAHALMTETVEDFEIVVVDDCSTDRTNSIVCSLQTTLPGIVLLRNPVNMNVGPSFQRAIASATKEYLFWQTIDWAYDISRLRLYLELLKSYDVVAGVRRAPVEAADRLPLARAILSLARIVSIEHVTRRSDTIAKACVSIVNYLLVRALFGLPLSDYQNVGFYPSRLIQSITWESRSSFSNPEVLLKMHWRGCSIVEVPISFIPRTVGVARGTSRAAIRRSVGDIWRLWWRWMVCGRRVVTRKGRIIRLVPADWDME